MGVVLFELWKKPLFKYGLSLGVLVLLILVFSLPALMIRTLGTNVVLNGEYNYANQRIDGGIIDYTLDIETVSLDQINDDLLAKILQQESQSTFRPSLDLDYPIYLHLNINDDNQITDIYLDEAPPEHTLYLMVDVAFIDYTNDREELTITGVQIEFDLGEFYMNVREIEALDNNYEQRDILVYTRIYNGRIQVLEIKKP